ncbi:MAG: membrane dipeptidase [Polyangiaceae bacterium]
MPVSLRTKVPSFLRFGVVLALGALSLSSGATPGDPPAATQGASAATAQSASPAAAQSAGPVTASTGEPAVGVVDLHVDVPWQVNDKGRDPLLLEGHASAANLTAGQYVGIVFPIYLSDKLHDGDGPRIEDAETMLGTIQKIIRTAGVFVPPGQAAEPGKITGFVSIEGAGAFAVDITKIDAFIDRGVRVIGPVHQKDNRLSTSATGDDREKFGLTDTGKKFCERVYSRGALIDVSHMSDKAFADLVPIAAKYGAPIVATHSNARAVADQSRNLTDAQLRKIAETGGVAGLNFHSHFVNGKPKSTMDDLVKQAEHMIKVAGVDHVAIGSDFDGGIKPPTGLDDASKMPALATALKKRGMSHGDVLKVFSLNALRVLGWRPATMVQAQIDAAKAADDARMKAFLGK